MAWQALIAFLGSFVCAAWLVRASRGHVQRYGIDKPQRFHMGDVPRVGGVALFSGWVLASLLAEWMPGLGGDEALSGDGDQFGVGVYLLVMLPAVVGGVYEDWTQRLTVRWRLLLSGVSASLAVIFLELTVPRLGLGAWDVVWHSMPMLGVALSLLAVSGLPHAFNIIDGYNGLAGMVALIVSLSLAYVAMKIGNWPLAGVAVCLAGATAGFLVWNYPRGLIFAGDGGAYLWGALIAVLSIQLVQSHDHVSPWFPMLLLIYPVWETVFSIYRKLVRGESPGVADALHFHQLIYRRLVRGVFHDDHARQMLMRNNRTSPYLWGFTMLTVVPAVLFWNNTPVLMGFCGLFVATYVAAYLMIIRFKVPAWLRR